MDALECRTLWTTKHKSVLRTNMGDWQNAFSWIASASLQDQAEKKYWILNMVHGLIFPKEEIVCL